MRCKALTLRIRRATLKLIRRQQIYPECQSIVCYEALDAFQYRRCLSFFIK